MRATRSPARPEVRASGGWSTRAAAAAVVVFALAAPTADAKKRPPRDHSRAAVAAHGAHVTYLTPHAAYLGIGADHGIGPGMTLTLNRNGRVIGSCKVIDASAHASRCEAGAGLQVGDTFRPPSPRRAPSPPKPLPSGPTPGEAAQARAAMASAPTELVPFAESQSSLSRLAAQHLRTEIALSEGLYAVDTQGDSAFVVQTVSAAARDTDLGGGFHTSIDVTALSYLRRPLSYRFPETAPTQLFVRQLELSFHSPNSPLNFAVGRIWPWQTPSIGVLDGAQLGWHAPGDRLVTGVIGGTLPDPVTTDPRWNNAHPLVAAYLGGLQASKGSGTWFQGDAVISGRFIPDAPGGAGWHYSLDGRAVWELGRWLDASAEVRAGTGVLQSPAGIELATLDLSLRPTERLQLSGSVRYVADAVDQVLEPGDVVDGSLGYSDADFSANAALSYDLRNLGFTLSGDFNRDTLTGLWRALAEGELRFPRLLGRAGGLGVGFDEAAGWSVGRDAYVQLDLFSGQPLDFMLRGSYFYDYVRAVSTSPAENGVSVMVQARLRLARWLSAKASVYSQAAVSPFTDGQPFPFGINAVVTVAAKF